MIREAVASGSWGALAQAASSYPEVGQYVRPIFRHSVDMAEHRCREARECRDSVRALFLEVETMCQRAQRCATISSVEPELQILRSRVRKPYQEAQTTLERAVEEVRSTQGLMDIVLAGVVNEAATHAASGD